MSQHDGQVGLTDDQLAAVTSLIQRRLAEPLKVSDLAAAAGMSGSCFARLFRAKTGRTPLTFITEERIRRAIELIEQPGGLTLAQIAVRCGFADQAHLTRTFRRVTGTTPARYCKAHGLAPR